MSSITDGGRRFGSWPVALAAGSLLLILAAGFVATELPSFLSAANARQLTVLVLFAGLPLLILTGRRAARRDWFHPLVIPVAYAYLVFVGPVAYILLTQRQVTTLLTPTRITVALVAVLILTLAGMLVGSRAGSLVRPSVRQERDLSWSLIRIFGFIASAAAIAFRFQTLRAGGEYGADQLTYGVDDFLDNLGQSLFLVGVVLTSVAEVRVRGRVWSAMSIALFVGYVLFSLRLGSRGELIAPMIFLLWAHHTMVRPIRFWRLALATVVAAFVFQGVGSARDGLSFFNGPRSAFENVVIGVGSPVHVTSVVVDRVPTIYPFSNGSTYVAALKRQLPSPIANSLFGPPNDTASFVFRRLIGLNSPDHGYSFAIPSEGYLNFGFPGAFLAGLFVGLLLGCSYRWCTSRPTRAIELLYPLLLAGLPHAIRTDALGGIKATLYPMIMIWVAFALSRTLRRDSALGSPPSQ